jgi:hypothetical protein
MELWILGIAIGFIIGHRMRQRETEKASYLALSWERAYRNLCLDWMVSENQRQGFYDMPNNWQNPIIKPELN